MQNLINEAPAKKNYDFIDAIRGISMISIVAEHSVTIGGYTFAFGSVKYWTFVSLTQLTKFGTVAFFLLAGFLISEKFADYSPGQYLKRRIATTFGPWLFWTFVYMVAMVISLHIKERIYHDNEFTLANILDQARILYLHTNYWFILNFLISISILLVFRRYLYSYYFGGILLLFTLFYAVNVHYEWVEPRHTTAVLGFVFFLWLGAQMRKHWEQIEKRATNISWLLLAVLFILTFALSLYEALELRNTSVDPFNTLRLSSILFSLVCFAILLRIKTFTFIKYLKPRQTTYGIYLIHYIILIFIIPEVFIHFNIYVYQLSTFQFLVFKGITFLLTYLSTFFIVLFISNSRAKKLVGN